MDMIAHKKCCLKQEMAFASGSVWGFYSLAGLHIEINWSGWSVSLLILCWYVVLTDTFRLETGEIYAYGFKSYLGGK